MDRNTELEVMLIRFYNMQAGTSFRTSNESNQEVAYKLLLKAEGDVVKAKDIIRKFVAEHPDMAKENMNGCLLANIEQAPVTEDKVSSSLGILEQALIKVISETSVPKIESEIMASVQDEVRSFIQKEYGSIERKVTTVIDGVKKDFGADVLHEKFDEVVKFVANNEPVYLVGPAGSGKNHLCKQVADALGLKFYFTNAVTQEYKLTGFTDAMGNYQPTQFYKAFKDGGLFMLDEMDASIPEVLIILNAALANGYFDFPAPIGYVEANPNFRVIAAGNTIGHGADHEYSGRSQLDGASLDRFAPIEIDYCREIEDRVALGNIEVVNFCRDFRNASKKAGLSVIVSYRGISRLAKMIQLLDIKEALKTCIVKGLEKDDINMILGDLPDSKFKDALKKL